MVKRLGISTFTTVLLVYGLTCPQPFKSDLVINDIELCSIYL